MKDFTIGGVITAGIVEAVTYFSIRYDFTSIEVNLLSYISGLIGYFAYLGFKKNDELKSISASLKPSSWDGNEIFAGFLGALVALSPTVIIGTLYK